jgi:DNA modification methylase
MVKLEWKTEQRKVDDLLPLEINPRKISENKKQELLKSLERFNLVDIPVINADGKLISGHQRCKVLQLAGRGQELIDVRVPNRMLTLKEVKEYNLISNTHSGEFDFDILDEFFTDIDFGDIGFEVVRPPAEPLAPIEIDEADDIDENYAETVQTDIMLGDLFQIGPHRLLCGDSTNSDDVAKLMGDDKADLVVTDPPYNTGMTGKNQGSQALWRGYEKKKGENERLTHMFEEKYTDEEWEAFQTAFFSNYAIFTKQDCTFYVFIDWRRVADIKSHLEQIADVKNVIVWDKVVHGLGSDYKYTYELCVVGKKGKPEINNRYELDYQDIWRVQRKMGKNKDHATAKPLELIDKPIKHASKTGDVVLDFFLGSGTTMVSSHKLNRKCYGLEKEPKYCQVIIDRMKKLFPGIEVKRIN